MMICMNAFAQNESPVRIEFDKSSKRVDMVTDRELPDYKYARRGSFQFFRGRLDKPEDVIYYFHDGKNSVPFKNLRSMQKFNSTFAQWRLRFESGRGESPQYIPRIHTLAVSFIPLNTETRKPEKRVYILLDDLNLIDRGNNE